MAGMTGWWDSQSNIQRQCKYIGYINNKKKKPAHLRFHPQYATLITTMKDNINMDSIYNSLNYEMAILTI
jgi:hypothetical protein